MAEQEEGKLSISGRWDHGAYCQREREAQNEEAATRAVADGRSGAHGGAGVRAAPFAYVTNYGSNNLSVIDIATNTVVPTVAVGPDPHSVAVTHLRQRSKLSSPATVS